MYFSVVSDAMVNYKSIAQDVLTLNWRANDDKEEGSLPVISDLPGAFNFHCLARLIRTSHRENYEGRPFRKLNCSRQQKRFWINSDIESSRKKSIEDVLTFLRAPRCIAKFKRCIPTLSKDISFVSHVKAHKKKKLNEFPFERCQSRADKERLSKRNELKHFHQRLSKWLADDNV